MLSPLGSHNILKNIWNKKFNIFVSLYQEAEAQGEDYDQLKLLEVTAEDAEKLDKRKKRKKNADVGFSGD